MKCQKCLLEKKKSDFRKEDICKACDPLEKRVYGEAVLDFLSDPSGCFDSDVGSNDTYGGGSDGFSGGGGESGGEGTDGDW